MTIPKAAKDTTKSNEYDDTEGGEGHHQVDTAELLRGRRNWQHIQSIVYLNFKELQKESKGRKYRQNGCQRKQT